VKPVNERRTPLSFRMSHKTNVLPVTGFVTYTDDYLAIVTVSYRAIVLIEAEIWLRTFGR
jgi:hypothetical protein